MKEHPPPKKKSSKEHLPRSFLQRNPSREQQRIPEVLPKSSPEEHPPKKSSKDTNQWKSSIPPRASSGSRASPESTL